MSKQLYEITLNPAKYTLGQYRDYHTLKDPVEKVAAITKFSVADLRKFKTGTVELLTNAIEEMFTADVMTMDNFSQRIWKVPAGDFAGLELGFIPDANLISLYEHIDGDGFSDQLADKNYSGVVDLAAVFFRPVVKQIGKHYIIRPYDSSNRWDYKDALEQLPLDRFFAALLFFSTIASELRTSSQTYLDQVRTKNRAEREMNITELLRP